MLYLGIVLWGIMDTDKKVGESGDIEWESIPENEHWLHEPEVKAKLNRAIAWAEANPLSETDLDDLEKRLLGD